MAGQQGSPITREYKISILDTAKSLLLAFEYNMRLYSYPIISRGGKYHLFSDMNSIDSGGFQNAGSIAGQLQIDSISLENSVLTVKIFYNDTTPAAPTIYYAFFDFP